jgi:hypothetical protein
MNKAIQVIGTFGEHHKVLRLDGRQSDVWAFSEWGILAKRHSVVFVITWNEPDVLVEEGLTVFEGSKAMCLKLARFAADNGLDENRDIEARWAAAYQSIAS